MVNSTLTLVIQKGPKKGETLECCPGRQIRIGRVVRGNTFAIKHPGISQKHLTISAGTDGSWRVSDLDTSNGTFVNDSQIAPLVPTLIKDGDILRIGMDTSILVRISGSTGGPEVQVEEVEEEEKKVEVRTTTRRYATRRAAHGVRGSATAVVEESDDVSKKKQGKHMLDIFSQLPDDILISVISLLTMKEAARTSVLARRWVKLWTFYSGTLDFDGQHLYCDEHHFVDWVNQVVKAHQGHSIDGFSIFCHLRSNHTTDVNAWISFAIQKRARNLKLDLICMKYSFNWRILYKLYFCRLSVSGHPVINGNTTNHICEEIPHADMPSFSDARFLTSLTLQGLNVSEADIYDILSSCPLLERLSVRHSRVLFSLNISGTSLKLKHLDISYCYDFQRLVIHDVSLTSFVYCGKPINVPFENIPLVSNLVILYRRYASLQTMLDKISMSLPRIESFTVDIPLWSIVGVIASLANFSLFRNLKNLEIHIQFVLTANLIPYAEVLKGSPFLHRLAIKIKSDLRFHSLSELEERSFTGGTEWSHGFLKVIEIIQFNGEMEVLDLAHRLLTIAVSLDKIIFHLFCTNHKLFKESFTMFGKKEAIARTKKLKSYLSPGAALIIS